MSINVTRTTTILKPDQSRVLFRPFAPGDSQRMSRIITRIMLLPESQVGPLLKEVSAEFSERHDQITERFRGAVRTTARVFTGSREDLPGTQAFDWLLLYGRILAGVCCAV